MTNHAAQEVLRQAGVALQGRLVGLWQATNGHVEPVATSLDRPLPPGAAQEINEALKSWGVPLGRGSRWLACRLDLGRWCIAPVRTEVPGPPPRGVERRRRERMTLELAGLGLGLLEQAREVVEALRQSRRELEDFFEHAAIGLLWVGADGTILRANQAELDTLGYNRDSYLGRNLAEFHVDQALVQDLLKRMRSGETLRNVEVRLRHRDGSERYVLMNSTARFEAGAFVHSRCFTRDITERKLAEAQLLHGALHDGLTGLPNRTLLLERGGRALERARRDASYRFGLLFLDFDHFKVINDSMGHAAGDALLVQAAARLERCTRPGDLVARLGGDEFILLMEDVADAEEGGLIARRLQRELAVPFVIEGQEVFTSASIGIALSATGYERAEDLLRDADIAMYRAKGAGRARYEVFDPGMRDRAVSRLKLETELRRALERGEFSLAFQPIVDLDSGAVDGLEALLRWEHPERGVVGPREFVPVAEETGLIMPVGRWVLREACRAASDWRRRFPKAPRLKVSVNISGVQLASPGFVSDVSSALSESGLEPELLRLEITETVMVERVEASDSVLHELRLLGVELHMDDFGQGYSSLSYLPRFPLDTIKIDRLFVHRLGMRRSDVEVVRTIVALAHNLGMQVIAEGVETPAQRSRLVGLGCRYGQGLLFSGPMRQDELERYLRGLERE